MTAPESVVEAVMEAICTVVQRRFQRAVVVDGVTVPPRGGCMTHRDAYGLPQWSERGCPVAARAADAAFAASLEWAADEAERQAGPLAARTFSGEPFAPIVTPHDLRRWARGDGQ